MRVPTQEVVALGGSMLLSHSRMLSHKRGWDAGVTKVKQTSGVNEALGLSSWFPRSLPTLRFSGKEQTAHIHSTM